MMSRFSLPLALLIAAGAASLPSLAQDAASTAAIANLPAICVENAAAAHGGAMGNMGDISMGNMGDSSMMGHNMMMMDLDQAHQDLMAGMAAMDADMQVGMTAKDIDVAFVCSMIPHHRGAIAMAKAELAHGDDPWVRDMAQKVIDAQEKEVADMLAWLEQQAK